MFAETRETETMLGPVVQAGLEAIKVNLKTTNYSEHYSSRSLPNSEKSTLPVEYKARRVLKRA